MDFWDIVILVELAEKLANGWTMNKITLPNGIILYPKGGWAESITQHAHQKGFAHIYAFLSEHPNGSQEYILVDYTDKQNGKVIEASQSFEDICCYIDMMWISKVNQ